MFQLLIEVDIFDTIPNRDHSKLANHTDCVNMLLYKINDIFSSIYFHV